MKKKINLHSRDNSNHYLKFEKEFDDTLIYKVITNFSYRLIYNDKSNIVALDLSGGPMIWLGNKDIIKNYQLDEIKDGCLIFKKII